MRELQVDCLPYEELKIGNTIFQLDISDVALEKYKAEFAGLAKDLKHATSYEEIRQALRTMINGIFISDTLNEPFEAFYNECGRSTVNMVRALNKITGVFAEIMALK
jgi:hypothetical protein